MSKTRIKTVSILNLSGCCKAYTLGETYNGLVLDHIDNNTSEFSDAVNVNYTGYTKDTEDEEPSMIFDVFNAPLEVQYEAVEDE